MPRPPQRTPTTRPPIDRMMKIHEQLSAGKPANCSTLARLLEVSTKTVQRDLEFMRDRLRLPVDYDASRRAYRYTEPVKSFPTMQVSEGEVFALLVAQRAVEQYKGTPFHAQLARTFEKLTAGLDGHVSFSADVAAAAISFTQVGSGPGNPAVFDVLSRCVLNGHEVAFQYRKPGSKQSDSRRIRPYHLAHRNGLWYVIGFDLARGGIRHFALPRIQQPRQLATRFTRPADFDPAAHFRSAFGASVGEPGGRVVIRFDASAAPFIRERTWHETQQLDPENDGGVTLRMDITDLEEVERWVLSWGRHAEVIEPPALRSSVREAGELVAQRHRN